MSGVCSLLSKEQLTQRTIMPMSSVAKVIWIIGINWCWFLEILIAIKQGTDEHNTINVELLCY